MLVLTSDVGLEPGLPVDQIESRLIDAARRHHLEERNIAYWLLELDRRRLYQARGFSSTGDYAMELVGIKPRKAQYLVFIASRLEKLPTIREAFDSGKLTWTKAREIVSVATPETEAEWLEKARVLSNRDLEKEVRRHDGRGSGAFATVTISMPVEVLEMWNDSYELAERLSGTALEKWQVLEPSLAEFLGTHLPIVAAAYGNGPSPSEAPETDDEKELPESVRNAVLDRDQWECSFPGCTMRKTLEVHHIVFRSRGGSNEPGNLICLCRMHHALVHRGICSISGTVGVDLKFERPRLVNETELKPREPVVLDEPTEPAKEEVAGAYDEIVGYFDSDPSSNPFPDSFSRLAAEQEAFELARLRRLESGRSHSPDLDAGAHVFAELLNTDRNAEDLEVQDPRPSGGPPGG